jgi:hypothetical protein
MNQIGFQAYVPARSPLSRSLPFGAILLVGALGCLIVADALSSKDGSRRIPAGDRRGSRLLIAAIACFLLPLLPTQRHIHRGLPPTRMSSVVLASHRRSSSRRSRWTMHRPAARSAAATSRAGEYYALLLFAALGMTAAWRWRTNCSLRSSRIEILSLALYVLTGIDRRSAQVRPRPPLSTSSSARSRRRSYVHGCIGFLFGATRHDVPTRDLDIFKTNGVFWRGA